MHWLPWPQTFHIKIAYLSFKQLKQFRSVYYFTKLDLCSAYNQVRIHKGNEWKTAYSNNNSHFEYLVMSYVLVCAPLMFQRLLNSVLRDMLRKFIISYIDDNLAYSPTNEGHFKELPLTVPSHPFKIHAKAFHEMLKWLTLQQSMSSSYKANRFERQHIVDSKRLHKLKAQDQAQDQDDHHIGPTPQYQHVIMVLLENKALRNTTVCKKHMSLAYLAIFPCI